jgi:hypothetical protein
MSINAHASTPLEETNEAINNVFVEAVDVESSNDEGEEKTAFPNWKNLNMHKIYVHLNPYTKDEKDGQANNYV